jgi:predicted Zn-dependent protease
MNQTQYSFTQEITAAAKLLEPLCNQGDISSPALRSSVGRIYLQGGIIHTATKHFSLVAADPTATEQMKQMNAALLASAEGQWTEASDILKAILEKDSENYVVCPFFLYIFYNLLDSDVFVV